MDQKLLEKIEHNHTFLKGDLIKLLSFEDQQDIDILYQKAYALKENAVGNRVYFRGIIEFSNVCNKDCFYCGIRKSNVHVERFSMDKSEILKAAQWAYENAYGSLVLQSGERVDDHFTDAIESILKEIRKNTNGKIGITLSLGEQSRETYDRWFQAGAHRYLLRIESSNPNLYQKLHPNDHDFNMRIQCLGILRDVGYQVGTGVMIGLPGQTIEHLADDVLFFKEQDIDMIGMGPYIPHHQTPFADVYSDWDGRKKNQLTLALKMIAVTRLYLQDVNIAATTALQALHPQGREMGIQAGANIIMPNVTDTQYRPNYQLYDEKPCLDENSTMCRGCLEKRISAIGEEIGYHEWGDSKHFFQRTGQ